MDWVIVYTALYLCLAYCGITTYAIVKEKYSMILSMLFGTIIGLPMYGRIFGWW